MTVLADGGAARSLDVRRAYAACGWIAAAAALAVAALWLRSIPPSLSSDDAFFFLHALTRFSILDFSPQFPGYPGYVAMGRVALLITHDPLAALALTSGAVALAIPPAAAWLAWRITGAASATLATFFITLLGPLMPDLAASLLSDGAGILFLLVFLALLPKPNEPARLRLFLAGLALGWAFACRPSDAPLLAGAFLAVVVIRHRWLPAIAVGAATVLVPAAATVYALEGPLYLEEGLRFLSGHATIWGNTAFTPAGDHASWLSALASIPFAIPAAILNLAGVAIAIAARSRPPALMATAAAFVAHAAWIAAFQNPDHLRHLAPLATLGGIILVGAVASLPVRPFRIAVLATFLAIEIAALVAIDPVAAIGRLSPLAAAREWLSAGRPDAVATNEGVFALRAELPAVRIYDEHYAADANLGLATASGTAFRLTGTPLRGVAAAVFPARFPGERTLYLYPALVAN